MIRKSVYGKTETECAKALRQATAAIDGGTYVEQKNITVKAWLEIWLQDYCLGLKERTRITYRSTVDIHIIPKIGAVKLPLLKPHMVQRFINDLKNLSPKSVKNVHGILHRALEKAVQLEYIAKNPAVNVSLPRIENREVNFLAGDDLRHFLETIRGNPYEKMFQLAIFTGMREGEILGLCWDAVDFVRGIITVRQQLQLIKGEYKIVATKNDKTRVLTPSCFVLEMLKVQRKEQAEQRLKAGSLWVNPNDFVFTRPMGENIARNTLYMNFKRAIKDAGLPESTRFHDLRHSYAVFALEAGDNVKEIQAALGHYSSAFTMNTYAHVSDDARRESAIRQEIAIAEIFGKSS